MNGKGSNRRPSQVSEKQVAENWERTFAVSSDDTRKAAKDMAKAWADRLRARAQWIEVNEARILFPPKR